MLAVPFLAVRTAVERDGLARIRAVRRVAAPATAAPSLERGGCVAVALVAGLGAARAVARRASTARSHSQGSSQPHSPRAFADLQLAQAAGAELRDERRQE